MNFKRKKARNQKETTHRPSSKQQKFHPFQKHSPRIKNKTKKTITPDEK